MQDTGFYISIDIALIITALAPTIAILATAWVQSKRRERARKQLDGIHTLVNDQMTREKAARVYDLRAQRIVLERVLGDEMSEADEAMLLEMDRQIEGLEQEVEKRNQMADELEGRSGIDQGPKRGAAPV